MSLNKAYIHFVEEDLLEKKFLPVSEKQSSKKIGDYFILYDIINSDNIYYDKEYITKIIILIYEKMKSRFSDINIEEFTLFFSYSLYICLSKNILGNPYNYKIIDLDKMGDYILTHFMKIYY